MTTSQTTVEKPSQMDTRPAETLVGTVRDAVAVTRDAAGEMAERVPDVAASAMAEATRQLQTGSDETLAAGATMSLGVAAGLLIGGANRILVAAVLMPALVLGAALLQRAQGRDRSRVRGA